MNSDLVQYTPVVDALLDHARNLTESDFVDLALAAIDQSDIPPDVQAGIRAHIQAGAAIRDVRRSTAAADARAARYRELGDRSEPRLHDGQCRMALARALGGDPNAPCTCSGAV